jgi:two-component system chemotaxis response regulator CheB
MNITVIGVSTGGPGALRELFDGLPRLETCILLVQHMPAFINESVRRSLSALTAMEVRLASDGDRLAHGQVLLAPSDVHMAVRRNRRVRLVGGEKVNYVCPAVDVTMLALEDRRGDQFVGVVLTGLGCDGAAGIRYMKSLGALTLVQDEATSTIYGMPGSAVETGCVDFEGPPGAIAGKIKGMFASQGERERCVARKS